MLYLERLYQMILEVSSNLVFYDFMWTQCTCKDVGSGSFYVREDRSTDMMLPSGLSVGISQHQQLAQAFHSPLEAKSLQVPCLAPLPLYKQPQSCNVAVLIWDVPRGRAARDLIFAFFFCINAMTNNLHLGKKATQDPLKTFLLSLFGNLFLHSISVAHVGDVKRK